MTYHPDLSPLTELPTPYSCVAIGWLEGDHNFNTGTIDKVIFVKLKQLTSDPWQPVFSVGIHDCSICQFDQAKGCSILYIPFDGNIYACPELIIHYISCHKYLPPDIFLKAVLNCPDTHSMEYKKLLLANGGKSLISRNI